ncbi:MAG: hypothetical protein H7Z17_14010 [Fuerstia sp.]|nr:hypothetical protein [Fuerstiella sp.]
MQMKRPVALGVGTVCSFFKPVREKQRFLTALFSPAGHSTGARQHRQKEGPDHYRGTHQNHANHHGPSQMPGRKILSPRRVRVFLFLLFSLLSMGQIAFVFVVHIVSLFLAPH